MIVPVKILATVTAASTGGRNGHSETTDKIVSVDLSVPKSMGGPGKPNTATLSTCSPPATQPASAARSTSSPRATKRTRPRPRRAARSASARASPAASASSSTSRSKTRACRRPSSKRSSARRTRRSAPIPRDARQRRGEIHRRRRLRPSAPPAGGALRFRRRTSRFVADVATAPKRAVAADCESAGWPWTTGRAPPSLASGGMIGDRCDALSAGVVPAVARLLQHGDGRLG